MTASYSGWLGSVNDIFTVDAGTDKTADTVPSGVVNSVILGKASGFHLMISGLSKISSFPSIRTEGGTKDFKIDSLLFTFF